MADASDCSAMPGPLVGDEGFPFHRMGNLRRRSGSVVLLRPEPESVDCLFSENKSFDQFRRRSIPPGTTSSRAVRAKPS